MRHLELGPGNSRIIALSLIYEGAVEVCQLDKYNRRMETYNQLNYAKKEEKFVDDKEADGMLTRDYRGQYIVDKNV